MTLTQWAQIAEVIIAAGTVVGLLFSIWYSRRTLQRADWNSSMTTAPSITFQCRRCNFWLGNSPSGGGSWGEPTNHLDPSENYITFELHFVVSNQGRGVALGIKQPIVKCQAATELADNRIPVSMGANNEDDSSFAVRIIEKHDRWLELVKQFLDMEIKISYLNDQGNVVCTSKWTAKLKPFDIEGRRLLIRRERISDSHAEIEYRVK